MKIRLNLKIFIFIAIFILTRQIEIYGIIMLFSIFHELGHMLAGILLGFKPNEIEIMPFGLSIGFESKLENYNHKIKKGTILTIKKMIIAICGPLTNLIFVLIFSIFKNPIIESKIELIIYANIIIGMFNLIPIYPLDGGRIAKYILNITEGRAKAYKYTNLISNITISMLTAISSIAVLYFKNVAILLILGYLWLLVIKENKRYKNKKVIYENIQKMYKNVEKEI